MYLFFFSSSVLLGSDTGLKPFHLWYSILVQSSSIKEASGHNTIHTAHRLLKQVIGAYTTGPLASTVLAQQTVDCPITHVSRSGQQAAFGAGPGGYYSLKAVGAHELLLRLLLLLMLLLLPLSPRVRHRRLPLARPQPGVSLP